MKKLIIVCGLPGAGKSTLAEALAAKLMVPIFSVDPIESSIIKSGIKKSFETGLAAYLVAETLASEQLKQALSVIIDSVSAMQEAKDMWRKLSAECDAKLIIIECILDEKLHRERIEARVRNLHGLPEVTWDDVGARKSEYVEWEEEKVVLDSADALGDNLRKALEYAQEQEL